MRGKFYQGFTNTSCLWLAHYRAEDSSICQTLVCMHMALCLCMSYIQSFNERASCVYSALYNGKTRPVYCIVTACIHIQAVMI